MLNIFLQQVARYVADFMPRAMEQLVRTAIHDAVVAKQWRDEVGFFKENGAELLEQVMPVQAMSSTIGGVLARLPMDVRGAPTVDWGRGQWNVSNVVVMGDTFEPDEAVPGGKQEDQLYRLLSQWGAASVKVETGTMKVEGSFAVRHVVRFMIPMAEAELTAVWLEAWGMRARREAENMLFYGMERTMKSEMEQLAEAKPERPKTAMQALQETIDTKGGTFLVTDPSTVTTYRVVVLPFEEAAIPQVMVDKVALSRIPVEVASQLDARGVRVPNWAIDQLFDVYNLTPDAARMMTVKKPQKPWNLSRDGYNELVRLGILKAVFKAQ